MSEPNPDPARDVVVRRLSRAAALWEQWRATESILHPTFLELYAMLEREDARVGFAYARTTLHTMLYDFLSQTKALAPGDAQRIAQVIAEACARELFPTETR